MLILFYLILLFSSENLLHLSVFSVRQGQQQSMSRPGLWSVWGPAPGVSVLWLILQSKSSSGSWESWQLSSHLSCSMLKSQAPGESRMESTIQKYRRKEWKEEWTLSFPDRFYLTAKEKRPLSSPQSISSDSSAQAAYLKHLTVWPQQCKRSCTLLGPQLSNQTLHPYSMQPHM